MPQCIFKSCKNNPRKNNLTAEVSYFRFPSNPVTCAEWISIVTRERRDFYKPAKTSVICSEHFDKLDISGNTNRRRLVKTAVPKLRIPPPPMDLELAAPNTKLSVSDIAVQGPKANLEVAGSSLEAGTSTLTSDNAESKNTISYVTVSVDCMSDGINETDKRTLNEQSLKITLARIRANPQLYIGVPKNCYHLIELLHKRTHISTTHILLCLKKVKLDTHFEELADQFGMLADEAQDIFIQKVPILAKTLESFIVNMDSAEAMQTNLPIPLRAEHHNTTSVIDSLELKVQPRTTKSKELTQSERGNTVKYLISCSPDGFINYVSPGYGGRHSDEKLLENTKYLNRFRPGASIIVNNGFRNAEPMLSQKGLKLLRPRAQKRSHTSHNVSQPEGLNAPCSKNEDNWILNDIERVVQRVRDYTMVRDHSVISSELVRVLDEAVVISCALINLQSLVIN